MHNGSVNGWQFHKGLVRLEMRQVPVNVLVTPNNTPAGNSLRYTSN